MRKQPWLLILAVGLIAVRAIAQEIVIEPTNGRASPARRLPHPAAVETGVVASKPAKVAKSATQSAAKSEDQSSSMAPKRARKTPTTQVAAKPAPSTQVIPSAPPTQTTAKGEAPEAMPAPQKLPARPAWAMADTRDALTLQSEISSALARDPKLARSTIQINVSDVEVTLAGKANGTEERLQAERLAQSYAWNRKLVDRIEVVPSMSSR
jgi:hypothetical protein